MTLPKRDDDQDREVDRKELTHSQQDTRPGEAAEKDLPPVGDERSARGPRIVITRGRAWWAACDAHPYSIRTNKGDFQKGHIENRDGAAKVSTLLLYRQTRPVDVSRGNADSHVNN